jgi:hypothetical protein
MEMEEPRNNRHGLLTAKVAREISPYWKKLGYQVLYDHDPASETVGKVVSSFGHLPYDRNTQLSHIDIAIIEKGRDGRDRAFALIEIEETTDKPKVLLGDVFGILTGEFISIRSDDRVKVDKQTILIVMAKSKFAHQQRNRYLLDKIVTAKKYLHTSNSAIEKILIKIFHDEGRTVKLLTSVLKRAFG